MAYQKGDTAAARAGGLALQAKLRAQRAAAQRLQDYAAALRTIYMHTLTTLETPEARLEHIRAYVAAVLDVHEGRMPEIAGGDTMSGP